MNRESEEIIGLPDRVEAERSLVRSPDRLPARYGETEPLGVDETGQFDYMRLLFSVWKHRRLVVAITVAMVVLAVIVTLLMTPMYRASATLQLDRDTISVVKVEGFEPTQTGEDRAFLQTQYELLQSRSLAEHVATKLGLANDAGFLPMKATGLFSYLKTLVVSPAPEELRAVAEERRNRVVDLLQANLTIEGIKTSRLVRVSFDHRDREVAQRVAESFAKTFIADNLDRKYSSSNYARTFLEERLQQLKVRLEENEKELRSYAEDNQIIRLDNENSLVSSKLAAMTENLSKAQDDRLRLEGIWKEAENADGFAITKVQESKTIQENRIKRDDLAAQYREKLNLFKPSFPEMVQLKARIDEFDRLIRQQIQDVKESIKRDYQSALAREDGIRGAITSLEQSLNDQRNKSIRYNILKREVDSSKTLYEGLLQRYKEIGVAGGVGTNNISLIDDAVLPERPRTPRVALNLALGLVLGFLFGVGTAIAIDHFDNRFKVPEDVEKTLGLAVLGIIPKVEGTGFDQALNDPKSAIAEAYRSLRTSIQFATSTGTPRSVYVTSTKPAEGKSTTAVVLAAKFTQLGLRVLLIDADMRKPSLHKKLVLSNEIGLSNHLVGVLTISEAVQRTGNDKLYVMTTGPLPPNPAELLASPRMVDLLSGAKQVFDLIIVDGPPLMGLADSVIAASLTEATILCVGANDARKNAAIVALRRLYASHARVIGAVFTRFDTKEVGYGYGYGYGYGNYYAYGDEATPALGSSAEAS